MQTQSILTRLRNILAILAGVLAIHGWADDSIAAGAEKRVYPLSANPIEVHDRLDSLKLGAVPTMTDAERKFLLKMWKLKSQDPGKKVVVEESELLDALIYASGVREEKDVVKYRKLFGELEKKVDQILKGKKGDYERGEALMKFLHNGIMKDGYKDDQSLFTDIFDSHKFNCVSSAAIYYILGTHVGLKLRMLSISGGAYMAGHATLDAIVDGKTLRVEPTNSEGFDWQAKINKPGVITFGIIPDRKYGYEIDGLGIAAQIYTNRCASLCHGELAKPMQAASCGLGALALDPGDPGAANNFLAIFVNLGPKLSAQKKYEDAVREMAFAASIAPKNGSISNNRHIVWSQYILATLAAGLDEKAVQLAARAGQAFPGDADYSSACYWFTRFSYKIIDEKNREEGLAVIERGVKAVPTSERSKMITARTNLFLRWSSSLLDKKDVDGSAKVLARAYALKPNDDELRSAVYYHVQEGLPVLAGKGVPAMVAHFHALQAQFPTFNKSIVQAACDHVTRKINKLLDAKQYADAIAAVDKYRELLPRAEDRADLGAMAYDGWARGLRHQKDWAAALDKYQEGLKAYPKSGRLANNAIATVEQWAHDSMAAKNWDEAIKAYDAGLQRFPDNSDLKHNKQYCESKK